MVIFISSQNKYDIYNLAKLKLLGKKINMSNISKIKKAHLRALKFKTSCLTRKFYLRYAKFVDYNNFFVLQNIIQEYIRNITAIFKLLYIH